MMRLVETARSHLGRLWWLGMCFLIIGFVTNFGTAVLRAPALFQPEPVDGASYYTGAWGMRLGMSPYVWTQDLLSFSQEEQGTTIRALPPASPPLWIWMYQALTVFKFPAAMWVWLAVQVLSVLCATHILVRVAGGAGYKATLAVFPFALTFGPTFLNLTIGQNGLYVLLGALLIGRYLHDVGRGMFIPVGMWLIGVASKIYPLVWVVILPFARRWRVAAAMIVAFLISFGAMARFYPTANHDYWFDYLLQRGREVTSDVSVDDQSLSAWLLLLGTTNRVSFRGLDVKTLHERVWQPPREISVKVMFILTLVILLGLAAFMVTLWVRGDMGRYSEGLLYMLVLFTLLPLPHMERYNHVTLLPAMAWLWAQGGRYRLLTLLAYCLVGLSRLNHLWAMIFPWPIGPVATGTCLYSVFVLGGGIAHRVWPRASRP